MQEAFDRCVSVLSASSRPDDLAPQVCLHAARCFATAGQFDACRQILSEMSQLFACLQRVLYFRVSTHAQSLGILKLVTHGLK